MSTIAIRLKQERIRIGLTPSELGEVGGVTEAMQDEFEAGKRSPPAGYLARILTAGIDVLYVLTGKPLPPTGNGKMDGVTDPADSIFELYSRQQALLDHLSESEGALAAKLATLCQNQLTIIATIKYLAAVADAQGYDDVLERTSTALKALNGNALIIAEVMMSAQWRSDDISMSPS